MLQFIRPVPVESLRLIVFDLDGTLIDSRQDLCNSVNATLTNFGLRPLPDEVIASFIGDGAAMLIRRALAESPQRRRLVAGDPETVPGELRDVSPQPTEDFFDEVFAYFLAYYRIHKLDFTTVYPGVMGALDALKTLPDGSARKMAVLTNKPVGPARAICDGLGLSPYFFNIYGGDSFVQKKPDPLGMLTLMAEAGAKPEETLMIGDSNVDVKTARNAGAWALGCTFGLAPETLKEEQPDAVADHASAWVLAAGGAEVRV
jgi:phosphoglycolate phosphatase